MTDVVAPEEQSRPPQLPPSSLRGRTPSGSSITTT